MLWNAHCNDRGELAPRLFRMCGFSIVNLPVTGGMMLAPPTMFYTGLFQGLNQTYNAGFNYGNKNSSCNYTNQDLIKGYSVALGSSVSLSLLLRKLSTSITRRATGT